MIGINKIFNQIFSFYLILDNKLTVLHTSEEIKNLITHKSASNSIFDILTVLDPPLNPSSKSEDFLNVPLMVQLIDSSLKLRGQIIKIQTDTFAFIATPCLSTDKTIGNILLRPNLSKPNESWADFFLINQLLKQQQNDLVNLLDKLTVRQSELETFKSTLDHTEDCIFIFNSLTFRFMYTNLSATTLTGYTQKELMDMTAFSFRQMESEDTYRKLLNSLISNNTSIVRFESLHLHRNGKEIPIETIIQYFTPANDFPRYIMIIRDITERNKIEKYKNDFISTVSHELRTPLTSIRGSLDVLLTETTDKFTDKSKKYLNIALSNTLRLTQIINDLLDIEKIEFGKMKLEMQPINIITIIQHSIKDNEVFAALHKVKLVFKESNNKVAVLANEQKLTQIIANLISNAIKHTPPGQNVEITLNQMGKYIRVNFTDHGPGISPEFQNKVFERFSQIETETYTNIKGSGLGLSISKSLITKMNGSIGFESTKGHGATFYIDIPVVVD